LRRPLGLFTAIVVIGVAFIALGMKTFGGTAPPPVYSATPLSSAQFAHLNENACVSLRQQLKAATHREPRTLADAARTVRSVASIIERLNMELDGRVPPPAAVAPFRRFLGEIQGAERAMHRLDRLTGTGQWQSATLLVRSRWWHDSVKQLGHSSKLNHVHCGPARRTGATLTAVRTMVSNGTSAATYYLAKPLSPAKFVGAVERICRSLRGRLQVTTAQKPTNATEAAGLVHAVTLLLDSYVAELRGLTPPPSVAPSFRRALTILRTEDRAVHFLDELERLGQWRSAARLVRSREWQNIGKRLGPPVNPADIQCG
jgi:hypothetical protein